MTARKALCFRAMIVVPTVLLALSISASTPVSFSKNELLETTELCLDCHDGMAESLDRSVHRVASESSSSSISVGCIGCHDGWEVHVEDPTVDNIETGSGLSVTTQAEICGRCHVTPHQTAMISTDPHGNAGVACLECHTIHFNSNEKLVANDREVFCLSCHGGIATEFRRRSAHPLESGNIRCVECHDLSGMQNPLFASGLDWTCQDCHSELSGPFLYEHPVVNAHLVEGGGCVECHQPHGSSNDRLLNQSGDGTCLQCHGIPPKHRVEHGGIAAQYTCVNCHSEVHGSFDNRMFLDPDLGMKMPFDCYQCHILGE